MHSYRPSRSFLPAVAGALLAAAAIPTAASAATPAARYVSPNGSGSACTAANPCGLMQALDLSDNGDDVTVAPGDYEITLHVARVYGGVTVHGVPGKPRPRLLLHDTPTPGVMVGGTLRDVEIVQNPSQQGLALSTDGGLLDQVVVHGSAQDGWPAVMSRNSVIKDSLVISPANHGQAIFTEAPSGITSVGTFRNVTALAPGSSGVAIRVRASNKGFANVLVKNAIARGGPGGDDIRTETDQTGTATLTIGNSNWSKSDAWLAGASIVDGGGNQTAPPAFVDAVSGNYHEAAGSPTIGAGLDEFMDGPLDIDGDPRSLFGIDIGADEYVVAPTAATGKASAIRTNSAKVGGSVDANGVATTYHFEYGPTSAYGSVTPTATAGSGGAMTAEATISGLTPDTTYHYRLVAANGGGAAHGADRTFITASPASASEQPAASGSHETTAGKAAFAGVQPSSTRLTYRHGVIALRLRCAAGTDGGCRGQAKLRARSVALGRARFTMAAGTQARVDVHVTRAGRRVLAGERHVRGKDVNVARDGAGAAKRTKTAVTIRHR